MDNSNPNSNIHLAAGAEEKKEALRKVLSKVDTSSIIGQCIATAIESGKPPFDQLIMELKDQLRDSPNSLKDIISEEGVELLKGI